MLSATGSTQKRPHKGNYLGRFAGPHIVAIVISNTGMGGWAQPPMSGGMLLSHNAPA